MNTRFAGATDLAERRRRRLSCEAMAPIMQPALRAGKENSSTEPAESSVSLSRSPSCPDLPGRSIVPGSWKVILFLGAVGFLLWAFVIWFSQSALAQDLGLGEIASLNGGALPRFFSTISLLVTSQLTLLIYWHRSRSRLDFLGRYRVWGWIGLFWCVICLANALEWHLPLLHWVDERFQIRCWRGPELTWMVPLSIGVLTVYRMAAREVNPSLPSSIAWNIAFVLSVVVGGMYLGLELFLPVEWQAPWRASVTMLWHLSLAIFSLIHARYVTYVTNEFGPKRLTMRSRAGRRIKSLLQQFGETLIGLAGPLVRRVLRVRGFSFRKISLPSMRTVRRIDVRSAASRVLGRRRIRWSKKDKTPDAKQVSIRATSKKNEASGQVVKQASAPVVQNRLEKGTGPDKKEAVKEVPEKTVTPRTSWRERISAVFAHWRKRRNEASQPSGEQLPRKAKDRAPGMESVSNAQKSQPPETKQAPPQSKDGPKENLVEKKRPAPPVVEKSAKSAVAEAKSSPPPEAKRADPPKNRVPGEPHFQKAPSASHAQSRSEPEPDWIDEDDDDFESDRRLSSRERKKLKKLQRQKGRDA